MGGGVVNFVLSVIQTIEGDFLFSARMETKTHIKDISEGFSNARKNAKLEGLRLHDLRHTAASKMIEAGVDLVTVSKILGHASIQMTI